jgi:formyltetrahydrofolate-dependent phosphoribosylglycinamide formyltransferase
MAAKIRLAVLGSTKGTDMQAIIDAIDAGKLNAHMTLVASDRKDALILKRASDHGIPVFVMDYGGSNDRANTERLLTEELKSKGGADLILLIGFAKILTPYLVGQFRGRIWNIHPSLLPKYAGGFNLDVHKLVLENHETETGCTLHEVTEEVDAGRIILQKRCPVLSADTVQTLKGKVQKLEQECFLEAISMASDGRLHIGA